MTFHAKTFPDRIAHGALGGPKFKTTVLSSKSGREQRNIDWEEVRGEWDVATGIETDDEFDEVREFFYARQGRAYSFRFHDWLDDTALSMNLGTGDGVETNFQCRKIYESGTYQYIRNITKINPSTEDSLRPNVSNPWNVKVNGVDQVEGAGDDYTVDRDTGIITFNAGSEPANGHVVTASFQFFAHVRFDTDHMIASMEKVNQTVWGNIPIVEIKEDLL